MSERILTHLGLSAQLPVADTAKQSMVKRQTR